MNTTSKIKSIIVDDEQNAIDVFLELIEDIDDIEVLATATNVDDAVDVIVKLRPELIFLDVEMPDKDGFDLIHEIQNFEIKPAIIFVTAFNEYAIKAIRHAAFDYLLKPVSAVELEKSIERFKSQKHELSREEKIEQLLRFIKPHHYSFNTRAGVLFIKAEDILYVKADGNYSIFYLADGTKQTVTMTLGHISGILKEDYFYRAGRSFIININYLLRTDRKYGFCELGHGQDKVQAKIPTKYLKEMERKMGRG